ncbi:hypothetical protein [Tenacibaculum amylolyticum]|uniref:hypothetical protein n=1 Tax=Tenacibaculum amylolyticum TaxID=104269 RepID=UPI003894DBCB
MASIYRLTLAKNPNTTFGEVNLKASCTVLFSDNEKKLGLQNNLRVLLFDKDASYDILNPYINAFYNRSEVDNFDIASLPSELEFDDSLTSTDNQKYILNETFSLKENRFYKTFESEEFTLQDRVSGSDLLVSNTTQKALRDEKKDSELEVYALAILTNELGGLVMKKSGFIKVNVVDIINT